MQYVYLGIVLVAFFLITIIPQRKRQKQLQEIRDSLKAGMKVRTAGGFLGTIVLVTDETVMIECGPGKVQLEILKGAVAPVEEPLPEKVEEPKEELEEPSEEPSGGKDPAPADPVPSEQFTDEPKE